MKIVGYTYYNGAHLMAMKSDSSLLNQRKPFFLPVDPKEISVHPCLVIRIDHLGRHIAEKFANRYYDAIALGLDFHNEKQLAAGAFTEGIAFDDSLAVGEWMAPTEVLPTEWEPILPITQAIAQISNHMTLRTGDLIYIPVRQDTFTPQPEQVFIGSLQGKEALYCKMK